MAAAGQYTVGGSFWEFGEPDWEHARYFLMFGVAEDHDSNPIKRGLGKLKARGAKIVAINPVRTGYAAIADEWIGIRPGTDGLFILALVHELLRLGRVDLDYLARLTDAGWLVVDAPGTDSRRPLRPRRAGPTPRRRRRYRRSAAGRVRDTTPSRRLPLPCPTGAARDRCLRYWRSAIAIRDTRPKRWQTDAASRRRRSGGSPPRSGTSPSSGRSRSSSHGRTPTGRRHAGVSRPAGGDPRHARDLRAFQRLPDLPRAAPAAAPDRQRRCSGRAGGTSHPIPAPARRDRGPRAGPRRSARASPCPARPSASRAVPRICCSRPTAARCGSTRRSAGMRRWPCTACCRRSSPTPGAAIPTPSRCCSCTWPTWPGTRP